MMKVYVGLYEHKHGSNVAVYASAQAAETARQLIADEGWDREIGNTRTRPADPKELADTYFDALDGREYFTIHECEVQH
jgi:hypothetical protein